LLENKIPAILFFCGKNIELYEEIVIYAIRNNFIIGNHTYSHPYLNMISYNEIETEIVKTDILINNCYNKTGIERKYNLFRAPYGSQGTDINIILNKYNYINPFSKEDNISIH